MVGVFGVAGNILTVFVLKRIDQNSTFNRLLTFLAIVDTLLLSYYVLDMGLVGTFIRSQPGCEGKILICLNLLQEQHFNSSRGLDSSLLK